MLLIVVIVRLLWYQTINNFLHSGNINALDDNTVQNQQAVTKTGAWVTINRVHSISTLS